MARLLLLVAMSALATACDATDDGGCRSGDRDFADGAVWTCADGCNGCICNGGEITSTLAFCPGPPGPAANMLSCEDGGREQRHGSSWACSDGCGTCGCDDGLITRDEASCGAAGGGATGP
jgi:hypothetical protein